MRPRQALPILFLGAVAVTAYGCDDFQSAQHEAATVPAPPPTTAATPAATAAATTPAPDPAAPAQQPIVAAMTPAADSPMARSIESAQAGGAAPAKAAPSPLLIKVEVLLDRAHFSPGVIDGRSGLNLTNALAAFAKARGGAGAGTVDGAALAALPAEDKGAITQSYTITAEDEAGPFIGKVPDGFEAQSKLDKLGYTDPAQGLAAKFHMSETLLKALNPGADFGTAGTSLVVVQPSMAPLPGVARVEVDKAANQVRAFDGGGKMVAAFPATVGSTERPAPSGELTVKSSTPDPDYTYDPTKLTFGPRSKGKLTIKPGPNNPVGSTWIALSLATYGIHGSPDPAKVGKAASHGCVRLTNWDATALGKAVSKGTPVVFVGETTKT